MKNNEAFQQFQRDHVRLNKTRRNRELRRERLGTVWTEHNLLALLPEQGLINQTT